MAESNQLKLENVRLSFPDIWEPKSVMGSDPKFGAQFLLDKKEHAELITTVKQILWKAAVDHFGKEEAKKLLDKKKLSLCLHEGSEKDYDGYDESNMYISSSSSKRPLIVDRDQTPLAEPDRKPYAGCYVNGVIRIWVQNNKFGNRVNAELMAIQFVRDGEPFGAGPVSADVFENLDEKEGKPAKKPKGRAERADEPPPDLKDGNDGPETDLDDDEIPF